VLLPNADSAVIDEAKLQDYLLSHAHPVGRFKARFFMAMGFSADRWAEPEAALRWQHLTNTRRKPSRRMVSPTRFALF